MTFPRYGLIRNMPGKRRILRIDGDTVHFSEEGVASRTAHRSRVTFLKDKPLPKPKWEQGTLFKRDAFGVRKVLEETPDGWIIRSKKGKALSKPASREQTVKRLRQIEYFKRQGVSKIAMRPVYHGTTKAGATKLKRLIKAKDTSNSSFKYVVGKPRTDGTMPKAGDTRPEGLYTTTSRESAEQYSITGRSPDSGGLSPRNNRGRVLVFNSVGAKPKYAGLGEEIYDPKKLGMPVATRSFKRAKEGKAELQRKETMDRIHDSGVADFRGRAHPAENYFASIRYGEKNGWKTTAEIRAAGRKKIFGDQPKPRKRAQPPAGGWPKNDFV